MYGGGANQTTTTNRQFIMTHHSLTHFKVSPSDAKKKIHLYGYRCSENNLRHATDNS